MYTCLIVAIVVILFAVDVTPLSVVSKCKQITCMEKNCTISQSNYACTDVHTDLWGKNLLCSIMLPMQQQFKASEMCKYQRIVAHKETVRIVSEIRKAMDLNRAHSPVVRQF